MISEEQLATWERIANEATEGPLCKNLSEQAYINKDFLIAAREAVPALIAEVRRLHAELDKVSDERSDFGVIGYFQGRADARDVVRQLEKEADWLAVYAPDCPCTIGANTFCIRHCPMYEERKEKYKHCGYNELREAARKAVQ